MRAARSSVALVSALVGSALLSFACGGSDTGGGSSEAASGSGGSGTVGKGGSGGAAGKAGTGGGTGAGAAGAAGAQAGKAGASGYAGSAGGSGFGGSSGAAGASGMAGKAGGGGGSSGGAGAGGSTQTPDVLVIEPSQLTLVVPIGQTKTQAYAVYGYYGAMKKDVTASCSLTLSHPAMGSFSGATLTAQDTGGKTFVNASCLGKAATADLTIVVQGTKIDPLLNPNLLDAFAKANASNDATLKPLIEYPLDQSVTPVNMPAPVIQWKAAAGQGLYHVHIKGQFVLFDVLTQALEAAVPEAAWAKLASTTAGSALTMTVESMNPNDMNTKHVSAPVTHKVSKDAIKGTAIYWWASNKGSIMYQTFGNTGAPATLKGDCTSCHTLSRAGTRLGYSRCLHGDCNVLRAGFMKFDKTSGTWVEAYDAYQSNIVGSYFAFSPVGNPFPTDDQSLALVSLNNGQLGLFNPDNGQPVASNIADVCAQAGASVTMPDWSADGKRIAYAVTPHPLQWIDISNSRVAVSTYSFIGGQHVFGPPLVITPPAIDLPQGKYDSFFFPSFSPDGSVVAVNGARAFWRNFSDAAAPGQRLFLADVAGNWTVDLAAANGAGDLNITWPRWAPLSDGEYLWLLFSSERPYGHLLTPSNSACKEPFMKQCKQMWVTAIDKSKLPGPGGMIKSDPSNPPVWLPGQDLNAHNLSPAWTVPAKKD